MNRRQHFGTSIIFGCLTLAFGQGAAFGQSGVFNSPHNLSASGGRGKHGIALTGEQRVCVFCHAPHNTKPSLPGLWNRNLPAESTPYKMYGSTTFDIAVGLKADRPTGSSRLCLSCHDGSIALNSYGGANPSDAPVFMPIDPVPTQSPNLGNDLSNSHPISFSYTSDLAIRMQLIIPAAIPEQIKLESGEMLQCTSCHDPHDNEFGNFLVIDNKLPGSPLCTACHNPTGWSDSTHNPAQTPSLGAACMNCHYVHGAPAPARLLHSQNEVDNCITSVCHNNATSPASANVQPLFASTYRHPVGFYTGQHDENEPLPARLTHVECVDCHNPHLVSRLNAPLSSPPAVDGPLKGVRGINKDTLGVVIATSEYEICFKCHSGGNAGNFSGITESPPNRMIAEPDQNKRFDRFRTSSFHPVTAQRLGNGASLLSTLQQTMQMIYCSDCHNSDQSAMAGGIGPNGPHGSRYEHILMDAYDMPQQPPSSVTPVFDFNTRYGLCFRCHAVAFVMGTGTGFVFNGVSEHSTHVQDRGIPCFACHDPHGVPLSGFTPLFSTHLINFTRTYAAGPAVPAPSYTPQSNFGAGTCTVNCHTTGTNGVNTHSYSNSSIVPLSLKPKLFK